MFKNSIINNDFFQEDTLQVAEKLLGKVLVRNIDGKRLSGRITEVEAYHGPDDLACHASKGKTKRTEVMFGEPGMIYVYMIYGMYFCLNIVTMPCEFPAAILIRGIEPIEGSEEMIKNRNLVDDKKNKLTDGPGKLCQALRIDRKLNGGILGKKSGLWVEDDGYVLNEKNITRSKRVGVSYAKHCAEWEWNFKLPS